MKRHPHPSADKNPFDDHDDKPIEPPLQPEPESEEAASESSGGSSEDPSP